VFYTVKATNDKNHRKGGPLDKAKISKENPNKNSHPKKATKATMRQLVNPYCPFLVLPKILKLVPYQPFIE